MANKVIFEIIENNPCDNIEVDFNNVIFISRSFADQFYIDKLKTIIQGWYKKSNV